MAVIPLPSPLATTHLLSVTVALLFLELHINEIIQYVAFCVWLLSLTTLSRFITQLSACSSGTLLAYFQVGLRPPKGRASPWAKAGLWTRLHHVQAQRRRKGEAGPTLTALSCRHEQPGGAGAGGARLQDALPAGLPHLSSRAHDPLLEKGPGRTAHFRVLAGLPGRLLHRHRAPVSARWKPVRPGSAERGLLGEASPPPPH